MWQVTPWLIDLTVYNHCVSYFSQERIPVSHQNSVKSTLIDHKTHRLPDATTILFLILLQNNGDLWRHTIVRRYDVRAHIDRKCTAHLFIVNASWVTLSITESSDGECWCGVSLRSYHNFYSILGAKLNSYLVCGVSCDQYIDLLFAPG